MKLSQIRSFVTVARYGKFSQAAIELNLTQPTVSHAIATLENDLGVQLLFRSKKGVNLTPAGESILAHCDRLLQSIEDIHQEANRFKSLGVGKIKISTFRGAAAQLLPQIRANFKTQYPQIAIEIAEEKDCPQVEQMIYEGKADIGFTILPTTKDLDTIEVLRDKYIVLLPPNITFSQPPNSAIAWTRLLSLPIVSYPDRNTCFRQIQNHFAGEGYKFQPAEQVRESDTIINLVATGVGAAILPQLSVFHIPEGVTVCELPKPLQRIVVAATPKDADLSHAVWAFIDFLKQYK
ncbi:LysR family transcriptional regulator [Waterburya agarophytonicola K14]|uniref:LysR family transcriptional regulator n=1 Tax=Waterburya agarophytonicola KI4 TaxID=2874699 RepID=A0A964BMT0_9CYAN|nr:LysR family transcriptional regulator [Waterburya agarophytonicola]MCC0175597.1 LysR family transcriptional regulator [Waterburya agarophytonicola KI4]